LLNVGGRRDGGKSAYGNEPSGKLIDISDKDQLNSLPVFREFAE
jgi:hypothetical protein